MNYLSSGNVSGSCSPRSSASSPGYQMTVNSPLYMPPSVEAGMPYLEIIEQPQEKFRFRYRSEMKGTHGCLLGRGATKDRSSMKEHKTFPMVKLHNYANEAVIRVTLCDANLRFHPHHIQKQPVVDENERPHEVVVGPVDDHMARLNSLCIIHIPKKNFAKAKLIEKMMDKKKEHLYWETGDVRDLTAAEEKAIKDEVEGIAKELDLNKVFLLFEAFCDLGNGRYQSICPPTRSMSVVNSKDVKKNNLKIVYLSTCSAVCTGGQEMCILVEKVNKNDITVQFFEEVNGNVWEREAKFSALGVHHQYAIVFNIPPYHSSNIMEPKDVFVRLWRKSDGEYSEPRKFKYTPQETSLKRGRVAPAEGSAVSPSKMPRVVYNLKTDPSVPDTPTAINIIEDIMNQQAASSNAEFQQIFTELSNAMPQSTSAMYQPYDQQIPVDPIYGQSNFDPQNVFGNIPQLEMNSWQQSGGDPGTNPAASYDPSFNRGWGPMQTDSVPSDKGKEAETDSDNCDKDSDEHREDELTARGHGDLVVQMGQLDLNRTPKEESTDVARTVALRIGEALQEWAASGNIEVLLNRLHHLFSLQNVEGENSNFTSALHTAVLNNKVDTLQLMLKVLVAVKDFATLDTTDLHNQTPLFLAVNAQSPVLVKHLLNAGANANIPDSFGNTPCHVAARHGQAEIVSLLIQAKEGKLAMNAKNYEGMTPLHVAVSHSSMSVVKILCEAKADVDEAENCQGRTALHFAAELGAVDIAACLIKHSADVNLPSYNGDSALHIAASLNNEDMCHLLMEAGADPYQEGNAGSDDSDEEEEDTEERSGKTPFDVAGNKNVEAILRREVTREVVLEGATALPESIKSQSNVMDSGIDLSSRELTSQRDLDGFDVLDTGAICKLVTVFNKASVGQHLLNKFNLPGLREQYKAEWKPGIWLINILEEHDVSLHDLQDGLDELGERDAAQVIRAALSMQSF